MGYRSCAAIALYGTPSKVDMVENMLLQKLDPAYDRDLFERARQMQDREIKHEHSTSTRRTIVWTFDNIKWYEAMDSYKNDLFEWAEEINDAVPAHEKDFHLAVEFVRFGEDDSDIERDGSSDSDYAMYVSRSIELPEGFTWKG